jgi:hypothetical protein
MQKGRKNEIMVTSKGGWRGQYPNGKKKEVGQRGKPGNEEEKEREQRIEIDNKLQQRTRTQAGKYGSHKKEGSGGRLKMDVEAPQGQAQGCGPLGGNGSRWEYT